MQLQKEEHVAAEVSADNNGEEMKSSDTNKNTSRGEDLQFISLFSSRVHQRRDVTNTTYDFNGYAGGGKGELPIKVTHLYGLLANLFGEAVAEDCIKKKMFGVEDSSTFDLPSCIAKIVSDSLEKFHPSCLVDAIAHAQGKKLSFFGETMDVDTATTISREDGGDSENNRVFDKNVPTGEISSWRKKCR